MSCARVEASFFPHRTGQRRRECYRIGIASRIFRQRSNLTREALTAGLRPINGSVVTVTPRKVIGLEGDSRSRTTECTQRHCSQEAHRPRRRTSVLDWMSTHHQHDRRGTLRDSLVMRRRDEHRPPQGSGGWSRLQHVTATPHRANHWLVVAQVDLFPKVGDEYLDDIGTAAEIVSPHFFQELRFGYYATRIQH